MRAILLASACASLAAARHKALNPPMLPAARSPCDVTIPGMWTGFFPREFSPRFKCAVVHADVDSSTLGCK
jgi:hypothetical protein